MYRWRNENIAIGYPSLEVFLMLFSFEIRLAMFKGFFSGMYATKSYFYCMKIIECPRDAMQGLKEFIPTENKIRYINALLKAGFDTIDFGSFVSPKAIPQMRDTAEVIEKINWKTSRSKLLAIVANARGARDAATYPGITYLGYPLSVSETFQQRNTKSSITDALNTLQDIRNICDAANKKLVVYISMGFGNPYGDPYNAELVTQFADILVTLGADVVSLADTIGASNPANIKNVFMNLRKQFPTLEPGAHLHATAKDAKEKVQAAFEAGCRRFDGAIRGFGGCPMANDELVGNIATEIIVSYLDEIAVKTDIDRTAFLEAQRVADSIFPAAGH